MHRVELKATRAGRFAFFNSTPVPNAPCGVESSYARGSIQSWFLFLMHRVELKAWMNTKSTSKKDCS